jgi:hypothetical protein
MGRFEIGNRGKIIIKLPRLLFGFKRFFPSVLKIPNLIQLRREKD